MLPSEALPDGGLYLRSARTLLEIHSLVEQIFASVANIAMRKMLASHRYSSGASLRGPSPPAAALAYLSAFSLPVIPLWPEE